MDSLRTAVLIFSRSAREEAVHKSFTKRGYQYNTAIANRLIQHTVTTANRSRLPVFTITERDQRGNSFGERLYNAIDTVFNKGFRNVIVLGNDSPELRLQDIVDARDQLYRGLPVAGPTVDGGVFLLGLSKAHFDQIAWKQISWKSSSVTKDLGAQLDFVWLRALVDIDSEEDIVRFLEWMGLQHLMEPPPVGELNKSKVPQNISYLRWFTCLGSNAPNEAA